MTKFIIALNIPHTERDQKNEATGEWETVYDYSNHIIEADTKEQAKRLAHIEAGFDYDNGEQAAYCMIADEQEFSQSIAIADFS